MQWGINCVISKLGNCAAITVYRHTRTQKVRYIRAHTHSDAPKTDVKT